MSEYKMTTVFKVMCISGALAANPKGMTVGEVHRACSFMGKIAIKNTLDELVYEGYAYQEKKPHGRTGKFVYGMTEAYAVEMAHVTRTFMEQRGG